MSLCPNCGENALQKRGEILKCTWCPYPDTHYVPSLETLEDLYQESTNMATRAVMDGNNMVIVQTPAPSYSSSSSSLSFNPPKARKPTTCTAKTFLDYIDTASQYIAIELHARSEDIVVHATKVFDACIKGDKLYQLPKDIGVIACCAIITALQMLEFGDAGMCTKYAIDAFIHIQPQKYSDPSSFENKVNNFLTVIQEQKIGSFLSQSTSTPLEHDIDHKPDLTLVAMRKFFWTNYVDPPDKALFFVENFFKEAMFNVWVLGKSPHLALSSIIFHTLIERCSKLRDILPEPEYSNFVTQMDENELTRRLYETFLKSNKKRKKPFTIEGQKKIFGKCLSMFKAEHGCAPLTKKKPTRSKKRKRDEEAPPPAKKARSEEPP